MRFGMAQHPRLLTNALCRPSLFRSSRDTMENRVTFSKKFTDAYGMSQPTFDFKLSTKGHLDAHRMMQDTEKSRWGTRGYLHGSEPSSLLPGWHSTYAGQLQRFAKTAGQKV
ncbi:hypothetical protein BDW60DRAFT_198973, partial [Aspergillus nidulans var. acristatus]